MSSVPSIETSTAVSLAVQIESCEVNAWQDMYAAAPADFARAHGLATWRVDGVVATRCTTIPFTHFNCVMNAGLAEPATESQLDQLMAQYHEAGIASFTVYTVPQSQPTQLASWLLARGFEPAGGWDRIYRDGRPQAEVMGPGAAGVERVTHHNAVEWARFIDTTYTLPTSPWLLALVGRPGWFHYLLRQRSQVAAVRSMYIHHDGGTWLGIDAPVPGLMAPSFDLDLALCRTMVRDALAIGARYFVADIEAPTPTADTTAYRHFASLGFQRMYFRGHQVLRAAGGNAWR